MQPHRVVVEPPTRSGGRQVHVGRTILGTAHGVADVLEFGRRAGAWDDVDLVDPADHPLLEWHGGGPDVW